MHRQFNAKVATSNHDTVGHRKDFVEQCYRAWLFDLGQDCSTAFGQRARLVHISGTLHKRQGQPVNAKITDEIQIAAIFFGQGRKRQDHVGDVHAFTVGNLTANDDFTISKIRAAIFDPQFDLTVIHQQVRTGFQRVENLNMWKLHAVYVASCIIQVQAERGTGDQFNTVVSCKDTNTQFWPLKVSKDSDWRVEVFFYFTDNRVADTDFGMVAVAHVEAEHVCAGFDQSADHLIVIGRRPKCRDDLYIAVASHVVFLNQTSNGDC